MLINLFKGIQSHPFFSVMASACIGAIFLCVLLIASSLQLYNADLIQPVSILVDIRNGIPISGWNWSPNGYYFPEIFFYAFLGSGLGFLNSVFIHNLYPLFSAFCFLLSACLIASKIFYFKLRNYYLGLLLPVWVGFIVALEQSIRLDFLYIILPFIHSASYIAGLIGLSLLIELSSQSHSHAIKKIEFGLVVLVFLFAFSDFFFIAWFSLPVLLSLWDLKRRKNIPGPFFWRYGIAIGVTSLVGYLLQKVINKTATSTGISPQKILLSFYKLSEILTSFSGITVYLSAIIAGGLFFYWWVHRHAHLPEERPVAMAQKIFWTWNLYSCYVSVGLIFLFGMFYDLGTFRYFQPLIFSGLFMMLWGLIRLVDFLALKDGVWMGKFLLFLLLTTGAFSLLGLPTYFSAYQNTREYQLYQCLENDGVGILYSEYWQSKPAYVFSQGTLMPRQITDDGRPYRYNNNNAWYSLQPDPPYRVAIMDDTALGRSTFRGEQIRNCNGFTYKLLPQDLTIQD